MNTEHDTGYRSGNTNDETQSEALNDAIDAPLPMLAAALTTRGPSARYYIVNGQIEKRVAGQDTVILPIPTDAARYALEGMA